MSERFTQVEGADIELVKSSGGVFEITVDGDLVYSKKATGRFPKWKEVEAIAARA